MMSRPLVNWLLIKCARFVSLFSPSLPSSAGSRALGVAFWRLLAPRGACWRLISDKIVCASRVSPGGFFLPLFDCVVV